MPKFNVEFWNTVYVTVPIEAATREEAEQIADARLPRYPVFAGLTGETREACPGAWVSGPGKDFEINEDAPDE